MSYARGNGQNGGHYYSNITQPVIIEANFVVDSANGNGLGVRSIKSNGYVQNVFMHTSATPGVGNGGITNPNPAVGWIWVQMKGNYKVYLGGTVGFVSPTSGSGLTSTTSGNPYVIGTLGTTTLAQWQAAGLPQGFTPTVGQSFIAKATGSIGGTGTVFAPGISGITNYEVFGDPNQLINSSNIASYGGGWVLVQLLGATSSSTTTLIPVAPTNGTVIGMSFKYDISAATIDGL